MADELVAFILSHGRPDNVLTIRALQNQGYTGRVFIVIDDEDKTGPQYIERYGAENVLIFSKAEIALTFDKAGEFGGRNAVVYARNACFELARNLGVRYFLQLDDDYSQYLFTIGEDPRMFGSVIKNLDRTFAIMLEYFKAIPALSIAMSQGGDWLGGFKSSTGSTIRTKRKAMNSFLCDTERPFQFSGKINEDVNAYVGLGHRGKLFLTIQMVRLTQMTTQKSAGGMTELYLDAGTYVKSFYTIMFAPSCVKITMMGHKHRRLHHRISWNNAVPKILHERYRRSPQQ